MVCVVVSRGEGIRGLLSCARATAGINASVATTSARETKNIRGLQLGWREEVGGTRNGAITLPRSYGTCRTLLYIPRPRVRGCHGHVRIQSEMLAVYRAR